MRSVRSIPAGAGEPDDDAGCTHRSQVYPRRCGGTRHQARAVTPRTGLSPQVRGNLQLQSGVDLPMGSIPAGAGEPPRDRGCATRTKVYPRRCGGTRLPVMTESPPSGLSPQVRGNQGLDIALAAPSGSIPAGAGEPPRPAPAARGARVYPRRCGGTHGTGWQRIGDVGLSPQVRGNQLGDAQVPHPEGSIPAGAGEPPPASASSRRGRVYPRRCGGTRLPVMTESPPSGLSPQVRGNRLAHHLRGDPPGSIPAGAGEPRGSATSGSRSAVYPRRCGGTSPP